MFVKVISIIQSFSDHPVQCAPVYSLRNFVGRFQYSQSARNYRRGKGVYRVVTSSAINDPRRTECEKTERKQILGRDNGHWRGRVGRL